MARSREPIRAQSFICKGKELVSLECLPAEERDMLAARLRVALLGAGYQGEGVFQAEGLPEQVQPETIG